MAAGIDSAIGYQFGPGQPYTDHGMTNDFADGIVNALNDSTPLYGMLIKEPANMVGLYMVGPMITSRDTGVSSVRAGGSGGGTSAGGDLPDPTTAGLKTWSTYPKNFFARIKQDGDDIDRGKDNGAFIKSLVLAEKTTMLNAKWDLNRQLHNDGSGRLVEIVTAGTTNTGRVNSDLAGAASVNAQLKRLCNRNLEVGMRVAAYTAAGVLHAPTGTNGGVFVIATTDNTFQVSATLGGAALDTSAGAGAWVAGDWIVRVSNDTPSSNMSSAYRADIMGIGGILNDVGCLDGIGASGSAQQVGSQLSDASVTASAAFFQGIACTTAEPYNRAVIISSGTGAPRSLSYDLLQQLVSDFEEANNGNPTLMLSGYRAFNEWGAISEKDKRYVNTMELPTGQKVLTFNGIPWWKDRMHVPGSISLLDMTMLRWHQVRAMGPVDYMGEGVWQRTSNKDAIWCTYKQTGNLVVTGGPRQRAGAKLVDLYT